MSIMSVLISSQRRHLIKTVGSFRFVIQQYPPNILHPYSIQLPIGGHILFIYNLIQHVDVEVYLNSEGTFPKNFRAFGAIMPECEPHAASCGFKGLYSSEKKPSNHHSE